MAGRSIDQRRLAQFLGMMGSLHDGEVVNAARMAHRLVAAAGLTWEQVLNGGGYTDEFVKKVAAQAYAEGKKDGAPKPLRKSFAGVAKLMLEEMDDLNEWEETFLESWTTKRYPPSDKQYAVFEGLAERAGMTLPERSVGWRDV